ncbi:hypothetical protein U9R90_18945 [Streptomyces sp. E11-3]|uniref:hypothetical protein n=1 Tax=Streptomyces sp. E11-3 TaxID=3110112 RepID=UPI00397F1AA8
MSEAKDVVARLREELAGAESNLGGAMMGIADSYIELAYGAGRGYNVHAQYRASNLHTGKPISAAQAASSTARSVIAARAGALDARRALLRQLEDED